MTHYIEEDRSVGSPSPEGEVIDSQLGDSSYLIGGQGHDRAKESGRRRRQSKPLREPCADLSTGGSPNGFQGLTKTNPYTRPGFYKGWESLGKNLAGTVHRLAEELAHMQDEWHTEACARQIGYHASRVAMSAFSGTETERTVSSLFRGSHLNLQQVINGLDADDLSTGWKRKKWG